MSSSLILKHQTPNRWRFCIDSSVPMDWIQLQQDIEDAFPPNYWGLRFNPSTRLIIVNSTSSLSDNPDCSLEFVYASIVQQLNHQGCQLSSIPLSTIEVLKSAPNPFRFKVHSFLEPLVNGISASLSLGFLLLSCVAFALGLVALYLPLLPGLWIMLLATLLFETALDLRRPFVA